MTLHKMVTISRLVLRCNNCTNRFYKPNAPKITKERYLSTDVQPKHKKKFKEEKEKVRMYIVQQYIDYVKRYTTVLEKRFPAAMKMYRVFSVGIKDFLKDLKRYILLRMKITSEKGFSKISREEIELYSKMPRDMIRIAPVLILSAIPFGNYIIFPLAFFKPKMLLCSHFWSIQQRAEFSRQDLADRLKNNRPVFRALQAKLDSIGDSEVKKVWSNIIALIGSGSHPTVEDILKCRKLFEGHPYHLSVLSYKHLGLLLKMHGYRKGVLRTSKLKYQAFLLLEMDKAIIREGGVNNLKSDTLRNACLMRGLNSTNLSNQSLRKWLSQWLAVTEKLDRNSYSLVLHCPILLAYNHPQNWMLIYKSNS